MLELNFDLLFKLLCKWSVVLFILVYCFDIKQQVLAGNTVLDSHHQHSRPEKTIELKFFDFPTQNESRTNDDEKILKRDKRFLLFTVAGISKTVIGFLMPVETRDRVNWRTLNMAYNFQFQYVPLPSTQFIWGKFTTDMRRRRRRFDEDGTYEMDASRLLIYRTIEIFLNSRGKNGRICLLKAICEVAEHPIEPIGIFDEILRLILTPYKDEPHAEHGNEYLNARLAGEHGVDCRNQYPECPPGDNLLDRVSVLL